MTDHLDVANLTAEEIAILFGESARHIMLYVLRNEKFSEANKEIIDLMVTSMTAISLEIRDEHVSNRGHLH